MEENITQRKTKTMNITVFCDAAQSKDIKEQLHGLAPLANKNNFTFSIQDPDSVSSINADLVLIASADESGASASLIKMLHNAGIPYTFISDAEKMANIFQELEQALEIGFSAADFAQIYGNGILMEKVKNQLMYFQKGISKIALDRPATIGDGIYPMSKQDALDYAGFFEDKKDNYKLKKFVPASGAASRMFKFLCEFIAEFNPEQDSINAYMNRKKDYSLKVFLVGLDKFPFFKEILAELKKNPEYPEWSKDIRYYNFIKIMLTDSRFNYANKPKGILPFHQYDNFIATPIYEHLKECAAYASSNGEAHVHFTITEDHLDDFIDCIRDVQDGVEQESGVKINFSFSTQHKETDTIAVDKNNAPFRNNDGSLLFRPGGHGALIENLNNLDADIVCIKNIDNVSHNNIKVIALYKKSLLGKLIKLKEQVFAFLHKLDQSDISEAEFSEILDFAKDRLFINVSKDIAKFTLPNKIEYVRDLLNRPIRICGMVKNEGEPGGGPFWVKENGRLSLQIVESSQIDLDNKGQHDILSRSTHFNPVDLVCSLKNYKGEQFDLTRFVDPNTGFIVKKNKLGKDVKSYELPGLWNGAMAEWITVFVEVPIETFNPVKTVNDLLKPAHQPI